ncbi:NAD(P)/FAD-dependent oxidoreductase [Anaeromyxobacter diazotrophicus]|uniref:Oxidoreductase n=1 Tax=Anaeromyxobacter diazotrophicus TaxID=2590199 RepID=A0A7I9VR99_9BACT|nr:FAD-dependent monooxygenase [Anaeromyxobacter diazotrophicus]GEJ58487.1 oxidoreductase [Anaeromyxobacter diazotrophicus]
MRDLVIAGGGPAGLALAAAAARRGLDALVLERGALPADKACGEGLLPAGVRALEELGARAHLDPSAHAPVRAIRWIDGARVAEARLPAPGGLGVRRTALSAALLAAARAAGAEVRERAAVLGHRRLAGEVRVETGAGEERARLLVAADGLASAIGRREGLEGPPRPGRRFGLRRHFAIAPWSDAVEVHFAEGVEAYVTPAGPGRVGVALLCEEAARDAYPRLLARFPALAARLAGAPTDSPLAGAGPLARAVRRRTLDRLVLLGDAAGYLDAITGEGLSLALAGALALGAALPAALQAGAGAASFAAWERGERLRYARYAAVTRLVLALARRPALRARALDRLGRHPALFARLVAAAVA